MTSSKSYEGSERKTFREVSRLLTIVENDLNNARLILQSLKVDPTTPLIGITGPPGAGKSTLVAGIVQELLKENHRVAVIAVDPTSPFSSGALLGDRVRMQSFSTNPNVYIRSLASRGSLGGLSAKTIEMVDVLRASGFDYILIETVGVGQSEVEIAAMADITLVVLVPESGDEVQSIKAGIMEVGDAFIVNKADREGADLFANTLMSLVRHPKILPVFKTVAITGEGITQIISFVKSFEAEPGKKEFLLAQKAFQLIQERRMADVSKKMLQLEIAAGIERPGFNLYKFVESKVKGS
jgi:LAO/AO transport system kinase